MCDAHAVHRFRGLPPSFIRLPDAFPWVRSDPRYKLAFVPTTPEDGQMPDVLVKRAPKPTHLRTRSGGPNKGASA
jgi:hypothetical protein